MIRNGSDSEVPFPELIRESTFDSSAAALIAVAGLLMWPIFRIVGLVLLVPVIVVGIKSGIVAVRNSQIRSQWVGEFSLKICCRELKQRVKDQPQLYILHVNHYGGFDTVGLRPSAVLEDIGSGELFAVHPPSHRVLRYCQRQGVQIVS